MWRCHCALACAPETPTGRTGIGLTYTASGGSGGSGGSGAKDANGYWVFDAKSLAYLGTTESALLEVGVTDEKGEAAADPS
ncbi:hypothetical protein J7I94_04960 [Streptomyces sp. ISL-12]|uniref:hypothetical protein n=1 Tax=Streptomyces sp. ISL-12 TaxID=2819177 RepID=UPI001BECA2DD|nr:hypothetical protein [Streptomyces sp. ISL-12]MBT2409910.1 hypothetical protein [Streptomyces sp. ISL-12]